MTYLPEGLPQPVVDSEGLSAPFWQGLRERRLLVQCCTQCNAWQFGPEWICHDCHTFDPDWAEVPPVGRIFSCERVWHPVHPALKDHGPYIVVLVELLHAPGLRLLGNLLGDPHQKVEIGAQVAGFFEDHQPSGGISNFTLLQWRLVEPSKD